MASVTQTIPSFTGGISEQPDQLKFPGQVKDVVNAIPDITRGLYKRPGAKRVGTALLYPTYNQVVRGFTTIVMKKKDLT